MAALGALALTITRAALASQFDARIRADAAALIQENRAEGLRDLIASVHVRDETPGALDFGLQAPDGAPIAGALKFARAPIGWSVVKADNSGERDGPDRLLVTRLAGGLSLAGGR